MKVSERNTDGSYTTLDIAATAVEVDRAFDAIQSRLIAYMGPEPEDGLSPEQAIADTFGVGNIDVIISPQVTEYLMPFALDREGIAPAWPPRIMNEKPAQRGQACDFSIKVPLKHQFELDSYEPPTVHMPAFTISDQQVNDQLREMAESYAEYLPTDPRPLKTGDACLIDIKSFSEGTPIAELTTENSFYELGSGMLGDQFEQKLLEMEVGQTKHFSFTEPAGSDGMPPKTIESTVTLLEIREKSVPVIDNSWIKENAPGVDSLDAFKELLRAEFLSSYSHEYEDMKRQAACTALAGRLQGNIDDEAMESMRQTLISNMRADLESQGGSLEKHIEENGGEQQFNFVMLMQAKEVLEQGFALDALYRHLNMELTDDDIMKASETLDPDNPHSVRERMEAAGCGFTLRETAERMKASTWLIEHATFIIDEG